MNRSWHEMMSSSEIYKRMLSQVVSWLALTKKKPGDQISYEDKRKLAKILSLSHGKSEKQCMSMMTAMWKNGHVNFSEVSTVYGAVENYQWGPPNQVNVTNTGKVVYDQPICSDGNSYIVGEVSDNFVEEFNLMQDRAHGIAKEKGFYDSPISDGELICMMHGELSEAMQAIREGNPPDSHLPSFDSVTVELADVIIRIMGFAGSRNLDVASAVKAKIEYNRSRPFMHGRKF